MFESKAGVILIAGLFMFILAFVVMGLLPWLIYIDQPEQTIEDLVADGVTPEFVDLAERFPKQFAEHFPDGPTRGSFATALLRGRDIYVAEGCWHCHSQQVRPISNEDLRYGPVSHAREYHNVLQRPVLFGTRRVGPDLIREAARHSNDWHVAHFNNPVFVSPTSVMPSYKWFFDEDDYPNRDGLSIISYVQWLGSWLPEYPYFRGEGPMGPTGPARDGIAAATLKKGGA